MMTGIGFIAGVALILWSAGADGPGVAKGAVTALAAYGVIEVFAWWLWR